MTFLIHIRVVFADENKNPNLIFINFGSIYSSLEYVKYIPDVKLISRVASGWKIKKKNSLTSDNQFDPYVPRLTWFIYGRKYSLPPISIAFRPKMFLKNSSYKKFLKIDLCDFRFRQIKIMDQSGIIFTFVHCVHNQSLRSIGWRLNFIFKKNLGPVPGPIQRDYKL